MSPFKTGIGPCGTDFDKERRSQIAQRWPRGTRVEVSRPGRMYRGVVCGFRALRPGVVVGWSKDGLDVRVLIDGLKSPELFPEQSLKRGDH